MKNVNTAIKKLVSFAVSALFTVVGALEAIRRMIADVRDKDLPVVKRDYMKLVSLCE